jgi:GNAT superfamily N-acetyltransferase
VAERRLLLEDGTVIEVRPFSPVDHSVTEITALLHRAYRSLADLGFRYWATHQDESATLSRLQSGHAFVACAGERIIGTITVYDAGQTSGAPWYDRPGVGKFGQFAVDPPFQGRGAGSWLVGLAETLARELGVRELALDTAEGATQLIAFYNRLGYRFVEHTQWSGTNYRSVILSKTLEATAVATAL